MEMKDPIESAANAAQFMEDLKKHHLAQVIATKYENDPRILGEHYDLNFTPTPPFECDGDDPARDSVILIISVKPEYKAPNFGNILIPEDQKGKYGGL